MNDRITILGISLQDEGVEVIVQDNLDRRQGVARVTSYFIEFRSEEFGQRAKDAIDELVDLAEDVHVGYRRLPKANGVSE